jgi:hypothetical protein
MNSKNAKRSLDVPEVAISLVLCMTACGAGLEVAPFDRRSFWIGMVPRLYLLERARLSGWTGPIRSQVVRIVPIEQVLPYEAAQARIR